MIFPYSVGWNAAHAAWDMISQAALELWSIRTGFKIRLHGLLADEIRCSY